MGVGVKDRVLFEHSVKLARDCQSFDKFVIGSAITVARAVRVATPMLSLAPCRRLFRRFKLDPFVAHLVSRSSQTFQLTILRYDVGRCASLSSNVSFIR
jgi:hypothetical protein